MAKLEIKCVYGKTVAFTINSEMYYLQTGPDFPRLYSHEMKKLIIPNVDSWLQAQTQQRYSFRSLRDMMDAFVCGYNYHYSQEELTELVNKICGLTIDNIFKSKYALDFSNAYKVELMEPKQVPKLIQQMRDNFDQYNEKFGNEKFRAYLYRVWKYCNLHLSDSSAVVESLIHRAGGETQEPKYPTLPAEVEIFNTIGKETHGYVKTIDAEIYNNVLLIQNNKVPE